MKLQDLRVRDTFYKICGKVVKRYKVYSTEVNYNAESDSTCPTSVHIKAYNPDLAHITENFGLHDEPIYKSLEEAQAQAALKTIKEKQMKRSDLSGGDCFYMSDDSGRTVYIVGYDEHRCVVNILSGDQSYVHSEVSVVRVKVSSLVYKETEKPLTFGDLEKGERFQFTTEHPSGDVRRIKLSPISEHCRYNYALLDGKDAGTLFSSDPLAIVRRDDPEE